MPKVNEGKTISSSGAKIQIRAVTKRFAKSGEVLSDLNLSLGSGEFLTILGPSGCGKSTLLRLISGLERPDKGEILIESFGRSLFKGFVFQEAQLLPWLSVLKNVSLPLELAGESKLESQKAALEAVEAVGLLGSANLLPHQLSGGMKMRVSVARALVTRPSLLLLDEAFSSLDEMNRFYLQEELRRLWQTYDMTVVFVTHSISEAVFLGDRVVLMSSRPGRIIYDKKLDLSEKRDESLRSDPAYLSCVQELSSLFRHGAIESAQ